MTEDIINAIEENNYFEICINIMLKINKNYIDKYKLNYPYPYVTFGVDLLSKNYGKIYIGNEDNELTYSIEEFEEYIDIYNCEDNDINQNFISIDVTDILQDENKIGMFDIDDEVVKCKLTLQDISYSDKIICLEAEIIE